jgi:RNA polymerase sigma-70 factor (ECF subfamily)
MNKKAEFEQNVKENQTNLIRFISSRINRNTDAEDIFQKACVTMWKRYNTFDSATDFMAWATTVASFEAKNHNRAFNRCPVSFDSEVYDVVSSIRLADMTEDNPMYEKIISALNSLDEESKRLVIGVYINGEEAKDLAKKAGKSPQTYYNKLNIARKKLVEQIK